MFGAKLSWCQIVRCQIVLVPNCPGAKLSTFIILVPNCPLLLSWCQIVRFIILVPNCPVLNCPVPNCPTIILIAHMIIIIVSSSHIKLWGKRGGGVGWGGRWISFYSSSVTLQMHALHEIFSKTWQLCFLNISWNRPHTYFKWTHGCRKDSREHCMMSMRQRDCSTLLVTISNIFWYWQPRMVEMYSAKSVLGKASKKLVGFRTKS